MSKFTLGKAERLKSRKRIEEIFQKGKKISIPPFRFLWMYEPANELPGLQFAAGVSARHFKKAVHRNRVKRVMREAWRTQKNNLREMIESKKLSLYVFATYNGHELPESLDVREKMRKLIVMLTEQLTR